MSTCSRTITQDLHRTRPVDVPIAVDIERVKPVGIESIRSVNGREISASFRLVDDIIAVFVDAFKGLLRRGRAYARSSTTY